MFSFLLPPLIETLRVHFALSKTRIETLAVLLVGLANGRTVNLSHLASQFPGGAMHASNYRRLQRFFQRERLDADVSVRLIVRMLKLDGPKLLALDRTNWKLGQGDVYILVLAVVTRRLRVPLIGTLLDHAGTSDAGQRIALMERYLRLFGASSIEALLADREFIRAEWMKFLNKNKIPFAIRLKENMQVHLEDGSLRQFRTFLRKRRRGAWAYRCATRTMGRKVIPRKTHGRREKSWFRIGLDALRNWIIHKPEYAVHAWTKTCPRRPLTQIQSA